MGETLKRDRVELAARAKGVIRAADVAGLGVSDTYLGYLARTGRLERIGRGLYALPDRNHSAHASLVEVAAYAPGSVMCLLSALRYHGVGTQSPHAVWIALPRKGWVPRITSVPLEVIRMSKASLSAGVETHLIEGVPVRIFSLAKTICDCFKHRRSVGIDVAVEALKDAVGTRKVQPADLHPFAVIDRVWTVMSPYLEAIQ
ncbi:MAG: transcriptional regulator [Armatimonadetes bacterium]|nr:transcriptional regulator [Armatimonadota bacterium]